MKRVIATVALAIAALAGGNSAVMAQDVRAGDLVIETPWARATPGGAKAGAGYFAVLNAGNAADRILSATTPIADRVELHKTEMDGGVMRMRKIDGGVEVPPGEVVRFKPGGLHLMFIGLNDPIKEGERFPLTVEFEKAGKVDLEFIAAGIGALNPPGKEKLERNIRGSSAGNAQDSTMGRQPEGGAAGALGSTAN